MNWTKFMEMSTKDKLKWIIHYYGIAIIVGIIAVCVISTLLFRIFGPHEEYAAKVMILDDRCSDDERIMIGEELQEQLGALCEVTAYHQSEEYQYQAFVVRLSGDSGLDFILGPEPQMKELEHNGYFKEVIPLESDAFYYQRTDEENRFPDKNLYFGIVGNRELEPEILDQVKSYFLDRK